MDHFKRIDVEVRQQLKAMYKKGVDMYQLQEDVQQEAYKIWLMQESKGNVKQVVTKATNSVKYEYLYKHKGETLIDCWTKPDKPKHFAGPISPSKGKNFWRQFTDIQQITHILENYEYRTREVQNSGNSKYDMARKIVGPCPVCGKKDCFTYYQTGKRFSWICWTEEKASYTHGENNLAGLFIVTLRCTSHQVVDKIISLLES